VTFTVHSDNPEPHSVAIVARPPTGFTDANDANNQTDELTFTPLPPPTVDASVESSQTTNGGFGRGRVFADVAVDPVGTDVMLTVTFDPDRLILTTPAGCEQVPGVITCPFTGATIPRQAFDVDVRGLGFIRALITFTVSVPGQDDAVPSNDTALEWISRWWDDD
jgi:hypothetical protein